MGIVTYERNRSGCVCLVSSQVIHPNSTQDPSAMETTNFSTLGAWDLITPYRMLSKSCCTDKDLLVLVSRLGGRDRLSLWKMQGSKAWEVDVGLEEATNVDIIDVAWSPDGSFCFLLTFGPNPDRRIGQTIAVIQDPPSVTIHSIQDGHKETILPLLFETNVQGVHTKLSSLSWFRRDVPTERTSIPDIFKRNDVITGSALSVLRILPLLDSFEQDIRLLTCVYIFDFKN